MSDKHTKLHTCDSKH